MSKVLVDEVFMQYFEKMSSASGGFAPRPYRGSTLWTLLGTSVKVKSKSKKKYTYIAHNTITNCL